MVINWKGDDSDSKKDKSNYRVMSVAEEQGPTGAVRALSREVFKTWPDVVWSWAVNLNVVLTELWAEGCSGDSPLPLSTLMTLWVLRSGLTGSSEPEYNWKVDKSLCITCAKCGWIQSAGIFHHGWQFAKTIFTKFLESCLCPHWYSSI